MKPFEVYPLFDVTPVRGEDCYLFDEQGNRYLDLYGGHAVISIGHGHPHYQQRLNQQLQNLSYYSNSVPIPQQQQLAKLLGETCGYPDYQLFLVNSGAEAVENALKVASFYTGKKEFICFEGGFHGRTAGALAVTDNPKIQAPFNHQEGIYRLPLNQLDLVEEHLNKGSVAAVIVEGIQGIAGIHCPDDDFLEGLRALCTQHQAVLILDEIQSGYGRTGKFFAHQHSGIQADLITIAKGMGNGFPVGGVLIHPKFEAHFGQLGTTFGGNHLACVAALAVLEVMEKDNLLKQAQEVGHYLVQQLAALLGPTNVRGKGLMLGLTFERPIKALRQFLLYEEHIFTGSAKDPHVLRLLPPLTLQAHHVDEFIKSLTKSLDHA